MRLILYIHTVAQFWSCVLPMCKHTCARPFQSSSKFFNEECSCCDSFAVLLELSALCEAGALSGFPPSRVLSSKNNLRVQNLLHMEQNMSPVQIFQDKNWLMQSHVTRNAAWFSQNYKTIAMFVKCYLYYKISSNSLCLYTFLEYYTK